jgi:F0F1-type ATP synthase membrane subunit b/b'
MNNMEAKNLFWQVAGVLITLVLALVFSLSPLSKYDLQVM